MKLLWAPVFCIGVLIPAQSFAWENKCSHPQITGNAISLLPNYVEVSVRFFDLQQGSYAEDSSRSPAAPDAVVFDHFYDPRTGAALHDDSTLDNFALEAGALLATGAQQQTALDRGEVMWTAAVTAYRSGAPGSKQKAYDRLGHALHLLTQDMAQPGHVHNHPHVPYDNFFTSVGLTWKGLDGSNASPLESDAERACLGQSGFGPFPGGNASNIPSGVPQTHVEFPELDIAEATARIAYDKAQFVGTVPFFIVDTTLTGQYIDVAGNHEIVRGFKADPTVASSDCQGNLHWEITGISQPILCNNPKVDYSGTAASHFTNDWWNIFTTENAVWDPYAATFNFYFHRYDQVYYGPPQNNTTLKTFLQETMLPISANYSAALLQLFARTVDNIPPTIQVQLADASGPVVKSGGYSGDTVYATVTDAGSPIASGVGYIALESIDTSGAVTSKGNIVQTPSGTDLANSFTPTFKGMTPNGLYQIHAIDGLGNHSYSTFTVVTTPPTLVLQSGQGTLPNGAVTTDNQISGAATTPQPPTFGAPIGQINAFQVAGPGLGAVSLNSTVGLGTGLASFNQALSAPSWYWIQACDQALNCVATSFCIDDAPPAASFCTAAGSGPGQPPSPPPGGSYPTATAPTTPTPPYSSPQPVPGQLPWTSPNPAVAKARQLGSGALAAHNAPAGPGYHIPGDPNSLHGPDGPVTPGQMMIYTLEFENVGDAPALGVYVTDTLDPALDETTLSLNSMYSLVFSSGVPISTTAANFPFAYDPQTRTVTVLAGDANPSAGGSFVLQARLRADAAPGTVVKNQGNVYFPTALQQLTPTNIVVSAVPLPTRNAVNWPRSIRQERRIV